MSAPQPTGVARHILPYLVAAVLVGVASGATWIVTGRSKSQPVTKSDTPPKGRRPVKQVEISEPVVGFLLPPKSKIGSIGKEKGIKGELYGRKGDLSKALSSPTLSGTLEVNLGQDLSGADKLSALESSPEAPAVEPAPGHILIQFKSAQQFLKFVEENQAKAQNEHDTAPTGTLTFDAMGKAVYVLGIIDGTEVDVAPTEQLDVRFPAGSVRLTAPS